MWLRDHLVSDFSAIVYDFAALNPGYTYNDLGNFLRPKQSRVAIADQQSVIGEWLNRRLLRLHAHLNLLLWLHVQLGFPPAVRLFTGQNNPADSINIILIK